MPRHELPVHYDVGARRAEVCRGPGLAVGQPAQELHLDGNREVLLLPHRLRVRRVQHQTVVPKRPVEAGGSTWRLFPNEPVLGRETVVRERLTKEDVAELLVEGGPFVVADLQQALLDPEGVVDVHTKIVAGELHRPVFQILPVEQLNPVLGVGSALCPAGGRSLPGRHRSCTAEEEREGQC